MLYQLLPPPWTLFALLAVESTVGLLTTGVKLQLLISASVALQ